MDKHRIGYIPLVDQDTVIMVSYETDVTYGMGEPMGYPICVQEICLSVGREYNIPTHSKDENLKKKKRKAKRNRLEMCRHPFSLY